MKARIFVRDLTEQEQQSLIAGLRSSDAFVLRRSQILLASARGESAPRIAKALSCDEQTVRHAIPAFNQTGRSALQAVPTTWSRSCEQTSLPSNSKRSCIAHLAI